MEQLQLVTNQQHDDLKDLGFKNLSFEGSIINEKPTIALALKWLRDKKSFKLGIDVHKKICKAIGDLNLTFPIISEKMGIKNKEEYKNTKGLKHTEGEWELQETTSRYYVNAYDSICEVYKHTWPSIENDVQDKANAKLIAAAPDLLKALIDLEKYVVRECMIVHELPDTQIDIILRDVRQAIKKAIE